jgi:hypothetical protein
MPGLREASFPHPIYADRFLNDPYMQALWTHNKEVAIETLRIKRRDVMVSKPQHLMDTTELWIRRFAKQNEAYSLSWSDQYNDVERHMAEFQSIAMAGDRERAIHFHRDWLEAEAANDPKDNIPFRLQAEFVHRFLLGEQSQASGRNGGRSASAQDRDSRGSPAASFVQSATGARESSLAYRCTQTPCTNFISCQIRPNNVIGGRFCRTHRCHSGGCCRQIGPCAAGNIDGNAPADIRQKISAFMPRALSSGTRYL